ncbi:hypothetical protein [Wolbachia endosymbiont (group E) of Neria commutata]|uniref:hypothetical protein n=1 Tax=Wolbachia endosymbiont (group E) of Neria commutata TaxID=3066149 RepID=UPI0031330227
MKSSIKFNHVTDYKVYDMSKYGAGAKSYTIKSLKDPKDPASEANYYASIDPVDNGMSSLIIHSRYPSEKGSIHFGTQECRLLTEPVCLDSKAWVEFEVPDNRYLGYQQDGQGLSLIDMEMV